MIGDFFFVGGLPATMHGRTPQTGCSATFLGYVEGRTCYRYASSYVFYWKMFNALSRTRGGSWQGGQ